MKGTNELKINQDTMIQAVQLWLASKMPSETPTVTKVEKSGDSPYSCDFFTVTVTEKKAGAE